MENEPTISEYLEIFKRRWWLIGACTVGCVGIAIIWSLLSEPLFQSEARVLLNNDSAAEIFDPVGSSNNTGLLDRQLENEARFVTSDIVGERADDRLREMGVTNVLPGDSLTDDVRITTSQSSEADELTIRAVAKSASASAAIASVYAETYIELRAQLAVDDILETRGVIQERYDAVQRQLEELGETDDIQRNVLSSQLTTYGNALGDLSVVGELGSSNAQIIRRPLVPNGPFEPRIARNAILGLFVGALVGAGLALLSDTLDTSISSRERLVTVSGGLTNLAVVPTVNDWRERDTTQIVTMDKPRSQTTEAYRVLRSSLEFATLDLDVKTLQLTSANPGDGKTTTAVNLAVAIAQNGRRVLLIDCDLRKPRVHSFFGAKVEPGFTDLLLNNPVQTYNVDFGAGVLSVLPSGALPPGPSEVLGSERTATILATLRESYDMIIVDSAPVLPVSDALVLAKQVDATVVVANGSRTSTDQLSEALERLRQIDARVIGTVLNQVRKGTKGYGYGYGYGDEEGPAKKSASSRR